MPHLCLPRRVLLALSAVAFAAVAVPALAKCPEEGQPQGKVEALDIATAKAKVHFKVEVVDTEARRETGLMCRKTMARDHGMLFDFKTVAPQAFWMKNTILPLDMLFIAADGRIVSIARNAVPFDETAIPSGAPVLAVLEINGGEADKDGIEPGDRITHRIFH